MDRRSGWENWPGAGDRPGEGGDDRTANREKKIRVRRKGTAY